MYISIFKRGTLASLAVLAFVISSCNPDDPVVPNEEELITTLIYTLTPTGGGAEVVLRFQDLDGDGGDAPIISTDTMAANTTYTGEITLLNELVNPADSISNEVAEEDEEHQFFFLHDLNDMTIDYADVDGNGNPIGLATDLVTINAETGQLTIILRHEPAKDAAGVSDGDITNAGGETDIEVTFDVVVE